MNIENFFRLLIDCARDPRFNADILMAEINRVTDLDIIDQAALPLRDHPDHQEAAAGAGGPVRVDLPQRFSGLGRGRTTG